MNTPARPNTRAITTDIPEHLVDDFLETARKFLVNARGGRTASQRAAEVRAQDKDNGLDSLSHLLSVAEGTTGQACVIARFLAGLYDGATFPFDLTQLRGVDVDLLEHCLAVLRLDNWGSVEIHQYFANGSARLQALIANWNLDDRPEPAPAPVVGERYRARYVTHSEAPGYRDISLFVLLGDDAQGEVPIEMHFSAGDSLGMAKDILDIHRRAWGGNGPIDAKEGERRPIWI